MSGRQWRAICDMLHKSPNRSAQTSTHEAWKLKDRSEKLSTEITSTINCGGSHVCHIDRIFSINGVPLGLPCLRDLLVRA